MAMDAARKVVGGVLVAVTGAARHAVWYLRYQVDGVTRDESPPPAEDPEPETE
jgi:hypothetical protein